VSDHSLQSSRILIVSREVSALNLLSGIGKSNGWHLEIAKSGWEALERVQVGAAPDVIILDVAQDESEGLHTLRWLRRVRHDMHVLLLSHSGNDEQKMEAMRLGAEKYLVYPLKEQQLEDAIRWSLSDEGSSDPGEEIEQIADDQFFVAAGIAMRKLRAQLELLAQVSEPLLIVGENGSGKELAARLVHRLSVRSGFRFFKLNCAALPGDVLESELFGYRAAPGNGWSRLSKLELCHRGTLFLDEITEMPASLQLKLLTALQEGYFIKADGQSRVEMEVRILAAARGNLEQAMAEGKLREDLYYRLSAFTVHVPPLRERKEEIPLLLGHFMNQLARRYGLPARMFSPDMLAACQRYDWPGNLRELEQFVKRHLLMGEDGVAPGAPEQDDTVPEDLRQLPSNEIPRTEASPNGGSISGLKSLLQSVKGETERNAIATALEQTRWNRKAAACLLKVSYRTLLYKIQQYHMSPPDYIPPAGRGWIKNGHIR
jgi:two-component system, NtrC family, response regulator AtoC